MGLGWRRMGVEWGWFRLGLCLCLSLCLGEV